ncbi:MAG TPA: NADH-quinone oxidoreductase subunit C, partial [Candidatus Lustribacter sp.]|nr:NADH-quinone oxidoreductase subunit C [Candidatus Lustribacter sp.]
GGDPVSMPARAEVRHTSHDRLVADVAALLADGWRLALAAAHEDPEGFRVVYTFLRQRAAPVELWVTRPREQAWLPTLAALSYPAGRFEREMRDLYGIEPRDHPMPRRLVRHGHWPVGYYPMLRNADPEPRFDEDVGSYPFVEVEGEGVYEIPVGPVHAGLIEPGHFRFSVVGETILRMKARLWFLHRGVEKLLEGRAPEQGIELAERVSGDTAVGHSLAFVMAVEQARGVEVPPRALAVRALLLELERLYNHVSDIGAIVNDVGYGIVHAHTQRLREQLLRHNKHVTGHRLLRGAVVIGDAGLSGEPDLGLIGDVARATAELVDIALGNHVVNDRLTGTAVLDTEQARLLGTLGYVARASGLEGDARLDHPFVGLPAGFEPAVQTSGDVMARFLVRADEVRAGAALVAAYAEAARTASPSVPATDRAVAPAESHGFGVVEAWRGALCQRVELAPDGTLSRVKIVDPSFFNWPALPVALADTIVPDFPLANKSFNQSYAGNDL